MTAYKFSECATANKPDNQITQLLEEAQRGEKLTREQKDRIADLLYGTFGAHAQGCYKLAGWCWNMREALPRFLVRHTYDNTFTPYYAPDKTALRSVLDHVSEIVGPIAKRGQHGAN